MNCLKFVKRFQTKNKEKVNLHKGLSLEISIKMAKYSEKSGIKKKALTL